MNAQQGFKANITTLGRGPRRALALHCTMAFGGAWGGLARHMGDRLTMVAPDLPSHGGSVDWDEVSDFVQTSFDAALRTMDDAPMDIIGHSFGAALALRLAVTHPEKVRSLTVIEPVFFAMALSRAPETMRQHDVVAKPSFDALDAGDRETAARVFNRMWSEEAPRWDALPARTRAAMVRAIHVVPAQHNFLFNDTAELLAPGALDAVTIPTLVMRGVNAHQAIIATNDGLAEIMPNAVQSVVEGAGHMAPISHPELVADAMEVLLARS